MQLSKGLGRMQKAGSGKADDGTKKKMVRLTFEAVVTKALRERLGPRLGALVKLEGTGNAADLDINVNSICPDRAPTVCSLNIYSRATFKEDAAPQVTRGGPGEDSHASVALTKVMNRATDSVLSIQVDTHYDPVIWGWMGDAFAGGDYVLKLKPLQLDLPFDGKGGEAESAEDKDPGEKLAEKKTK